VLLLVVGEESSSGSLGNASGYEKLSNPLGCNPNSRKSSLRYLLIRQPHGQEMMTVVLRLTFQIGSKTKIAAALGGNPLVGVLEKMATPFHPLVIRELQASLPLAEDRTMPPKGEASISQIYEQRIDIGCLESNDLEGQTSFELLDSKLWLCRGPPLFVFGIARRWEG
jgi:hypothetical protein